MNKWIGLKMVKMERNVHLVPMNRVNNSRQGFGFLYICARCWSFSLCPSFYHITPLPSFIFSYVLGLFLCCFFFVGSLACVVRCVCACPFLRRWQRRYTGDCPFPPPPPPVLKDPKAHQNTLKNLRESLVDPWWILDDPEMDRFRICNSGWGCFSRVEYPQESLTGIPRNG